MAKVLERFLVFRKEDCDAYSPGVSDTYRGFEYYADDTDIRNCYDFTVIRNKVYKKYTVFCDNFSTAAKVLTEANPKSTVMGGFKRRAPLPDACPIISGEIREKFWGFRPPVMAVDSIPG